MRLILRTLVPAAVLAVGLAGATSAHAQAKARQCRDCHPAIYAEWKKSQHAKAYTDPRFQAALKLAEKPETCTPCHAPNPILDAGVGKYPTLRGNRPNKREGVSCVTCHAKGDAYAGPYQAKDMNDIGHYSAYEPAFKTYKLCATCHGQEKEKVHNQVRDFLKSRSAKKGKHCQDCHMPRIVRPAAVDTMGKEKYKARPGRQHTFVGSHDAGMLKKAATIEVKIATVKGKRVATVKVTNVKAAHAIPAAADRAIRVELVCTPTRGKPGPARLEVWGWDKRLQEDASRTATFPVPSGTGTAKATLWHCASPDDPRKEWAAMRTAEAAYR